MATHSMAYDHPAYNVRFSHAGEAGGASATQYMKFCAFTTMLAYAVQTTITVVGSVTSTFALVQVSGTTTTTTALTTVAVGTVGQTVRFPLTAGGVALAAGDVLAVVSGTDTALKQACAIELGLSQQASIST